MIQEIKTFNYLQTYRKRTGISSKEMAAMIGIDTGNLSKMESGKREPSIWVLIAYHVILKIPIEKLFKNQFKDVLSVCLQNSTTLKDQLLEEMTTPNLSHTVVLLDAIVDRLTELEKNSA
jgi:DNA-binding XRE family transcriptional regulator